MSQSAPAKNKTPKTPKAPKEPKEKPVLVSYLKSGAAPSSIVSADGLLTVADVREFGFDAERHDRLTSDDFQTEALWMQHRVIRLREQAARCTAKADQLEREASQIQKFGDPVKRAQAKKLGRVADQFAKLKAQLISEGVSEDEIAAMLGGAK
jgi:hypothetical protein